MGHWQYYVSREAVLLERYIRTVGYSQMFGRLSRHRVRQMLIINHRGLNTLYLNSFDEKRRLAIVKKEYQNGVFRKLLPFWQKIISQLNYYLHRTLTEPSIDYFKQFIKYYQLSRAIVFYTEELDKLIKQKKIKGSTDLIGHWHEQAEKASSLGWDKLQPFFRKIAKNHHLTIQQLMYYLPEEFFVLFKEGIKVPLKELRRRQDYYLLLLKDGRLKLYIGRTAQSLEKKARPQSSRLLKVKTLKGQAGFYGKVKGRVRIINTSAQAQSMKQGEILVSTMTPPRLIMAVKKAKAIVTNEGGLICHAAIIARELKIPCVIGTKIATQVLKDGDLVEVDANRGIVRKL